MGKTCGLRCQNEAISLPPRKPRTVDSILKTWKISDKKDAKHVGYGNGWVIGDSLNQRRRRTYALF